MADSNVKIVFTVENGEIITKSIDGIEQKLKETTKQTGLFGNAFKGLSSIVSPTKVLDFFGDCIKEAQVGESKIDNLKKQIGLELIPVVDKVTTSVEKFAQALYILPTPEVIQDIKELEKQGTSLQKEISNQEKTIIKLKERLKEPYSSPEAYAADLKKLKELEGQYKTNKTSAEKLNKELDKLKNPSKSKGEDIKDKEKEEEEKKKLEEKAEKDAKKIEEKKVEDAIELEKKKTETIAKMNETLSATIGDSLGQMAAGSKDAYKIMLKAALDYAQQMLIIDLGLSSGTALASKGIVGLFEIVALTAVFAGIKSSIDNIPAMAQGGIVTSPTVAMIGEAGPEAIIPLNRSGGVGKNITINVNGFANKNTIDYLIRELKRAENRGGGL